MIRCHVCHLPKAESFYFSCDRLKSSPINYICVCRIWILYLYPFNFPVTGREWPSAAHVSPSVKVVVTVVQNGKICKSVPCKATPNCIVVFLCTTAAEMIHGCIFTSLMYWSEISSRLRCLSERAKQTAIFGTSWKLLQSNSWWKTWPDVYQPPCDLSDQRWKSSNSCWVHLFLPWTECSGLLQETVHISHASGQSDQTWYLNFIWRKSEVNARKRERV